MSLFRRAVSFAARTMSSCAKNALVLLPPGCEEMELITAVDVLRRGGINVTLASVDNTQTVTGGHEIRICADTTLASCMDSIFDAVVLPGGLPAAKVMASSACVGGVLRAHAHNDRVVAAICAAPTVLRAHRIAVGKRITCYPSLGDEMRADYTYVPDADVVVDGGLITSRGPATAQKFALQVLACLADDVIADKVAKAMLVVPK